MEIVNKTSPLPKFVGAAVEGVSVSELRSPRARCLLAALMTTTGSSTNQVTCSGKPTHDRLITDQWADSVQTEGGRRPFLRFIPITEQVVTSDGARPAARITPPAQMQIAASKGTLVMFADININIGAGALAHSSVLMHRDVIREITNDVIITSAMETRNDSMEFQLTENGGGSFGRVNADRSRLETPVPEALGPSK
ncbi:hypothetical protein EVAR_83956_1 [Eumeta japonica]|uniref:Uncharacterized protein n=1 Tax=Eumeta variegata TaxID=151549 RepID=A0A4C1VME2_EUMVA|nr:hypothetical protein EVAR_83956_1 [Eumeta japonica]